MASSRLSSAARVAAIDLASGVDGPLPLLLLCLGVVTGLIDAFSYLALGHVFVANMTGNVVFLAFAIAAVPGFSVRYSVVALGAFGLGAIVFGRAMRWRSTSLNRALLLADATALQVLGFGACLALVASTSTSNDTTRLVAIALLAASLAVENATIRRIGVADVATTVLTLTITGLSADSSLGQARGARATRRGASVAAIFLGALLGATLVDHHWPDALLGIALGLLVVISLLTRRLARSDVAWLELRA